MCRPPFTNIHKTRSSKCYLGARIGKEKILAKIDQSKWLDVIVAELVSISVLVVPVAMVADVELMYLAAVPMEHHCNYPGCIDYVVHSVNTMFEVCVDFRREMKLRLIFRADYEISNTLPSAEHSRMVFPVLVVRVVEVVESVLVMLYHRVQY